MKNIKDIKKKRKSKIKTIIMVIAIIASIFLIIFGATIYLYIRALIGYDLTIKTNSDKENLFLSNGESDIIKIKSYAITNLFCTTECSSKFINLKTGDILEQDNFNLKLPKTKEFTLTAPEYGTGQDLYRFDLECKSQKTFICATTGESKKRTLLITLNYELSQEEKILKNQLEAQLNSEISRLNYLISSLDEMNNAAEKLKEILEIQPIIDNIQITNDSLSSSNEIAKNMKEIWESQDYKLLNEKNPGFNSSLSESESYFKILNLTLISNLSSYNYLLENITETKKQIEDMVKMNFSNNSIIEIKSLIKEFNNLMILLNKKDTLANKEYLVYDIFNKTQLISDLINEAQENITLTYTINETIQNLNLSKIEIKLVNFSLFELAEPDSKCCLYGKCESCCDEACFSNPEKYPIIFLHGHAFNEKASAETSLDSFEEIQRALDKDDYLNAGSMLLSVSDEKYKGIWGKTTSPITLKVSYYFDILTNEGENILIQTKKDNLDTYTLRLKDIINSVKYNTNREKVIIVSHSMGGLIARRYIQVFGENNIDKLIMLATPNKGISGTSLKYCSLFGTELECSDMDKNSLFMSKLNNAPVSSIPVYNIIGIGCNTDNEAGDGIVQNSSAYLEYADNYYIEGNCRESDFEYLHQEMLKPDKYPGVYDIIKKALKNSSQ